MNFLQEQNVLVSIRLNDSRSIVVSAIMLCAFGLFLLWLHSVGKITTMGIIALMVTGVIFVGLSNYFYKRLWSEAE